MVRCCTSSRRLRARSCNAGCGGGKMQRSGNSHSRRMWARSTALRSSPAYFRHSYYLMVAVLATCTAKSTSVSPSTSQYQLNSMHIIALQAELSVHRVRRRRRERCDIFLVCMSETLRQPTSGLAVQRARMLNRKVLVLPMKTLAR